MFRHLAYTLALVWGALVNYCLLPPLPIPVPLMLPAAAVSVGALEGAPTGAIYGGVAGLLYSALAYQSVAFLPLLSLVGWLSGLLAQYVLRRDFWGTLPCVLLTFLVWEVAQVVSRLAGGAGAAGVLVPIAAGELVCSLGFALPVYALCRFCCAHYGRIYHE